MINPTENDIGRTVVYTGNRYPGGELEEGIITSFNGSAVFVRYGADKGSKATSRSDLEWMTDDQMTEYNRRGIQRCMFAVEDQLAKANDVNATLDQMVARAATIVPAGPDREEFERHFRVLIRPLVELELKRREDS